MINFNIKGNGQPKTKAKVGLDIGTDYLKIIETSDSGRLRLTALGLKEITDHSPDALTGSIRILAEESKVSAKDVVISVSGQDVIVRFITMPKMRMEDLKSAIKFEAEKFIPFSINDCITDFQILSKDDRENKLNILLAAAEREHILGRIKAVERAGLSVALVDVDGFALVNSFLKNFPSLDASKSIALINIGAGCTNLSILRGPSIYFTRDMALGAADFTAAIAKRLGVAIKTAEGLKALSADKMQDAINYSKQALSGFIDDVRLSFSYYENQGGMSVDEIYISGGASDLMGLAETFVENFGSAPVSWNPLQFLDTTSAGLDAGLIDKKNGLFAVSSGLALR